MYKANFPQGQSAGVNPIFVTSNPEKYLRVEGLREALHKDYDGTVICAELSPRKDLPERGDYGYAYIPLKPDAIPQRQKKN